MAEWVLRIVRETDVRLEKEKRELVRDFCYSGISERNLETVIWYTFEPNARKWSTPVIPDLVFKVDLKTFKQLNSFFNT